MPASCPFRRNPLLTVFWAILLIALIAASGGFWLRYQNEAQNQTVIVTADYEEFLKTSNTAAIPMETTLKELQAAGVYSIALKEITTQTLADAGQVITRSWAEFIAPGTEWQKNPAAQLKALASDTYISPKAMVIVAEDQAVHDFLRERLTRRFNDNELFMLADAGKYYFLINQETFPLVYEKNVTPVNSVVLGFDEDLLAQLKAQGFEVILRPGYNMGSNRQYIQELEPLISKYDIKLLLPANSILQGSPADIDFMADLVSRHHLLVGIIETPEQIGYIPQKGLDDLLKKTDFQVSRVFSSGSDDFIKQKEERYYRWVRSVIDRGIRIMYIRPFRESKISQTENLQNTIKILADFNQTMTDKGFTLNQDLPHPDPRPLGSFNQLMIIISLLAAGCLYLYYLLRLPLGRLMLLFLAGLLAGGLLTIALNLDLAKVCALGAAILYPALSSILLLMYLRDHPHIHWLPKIGAALAITIGINALGMYSIVSSLADVRYIMNIESFRGVKIAFMVPLLLFLLNYASCFRTQPSLGSSIYSLLRQKPDYLVLAAGCVFLLALYIYVGRSGNTSGITVSNTEIRLRELLEHIFLARPRFKEIIISYPCLLAMVYLYHKYRKAPILLVTGLGVIMGSISMLNSFSHVFTDISISFSRTLAGLAVGLAVGICLLAIIRIGEKIFYSWYGQP